MAHENVRLPWIGAHLPRRGTGLRRVLGEGLLALMGWRFEGDLPDLPKFIAIVAPHTSNWDFIVGMAALFALRLDVRWLGKDSLFRWPMGGLMRRLGGLPVYRSASRGVVEQIVSAFNEKERLIVALAPEGTRRPVTKWRTGFYHMALGAQVPIFPASLDYGRKVIGLGAVLQPSGDLEADLKTLRAFYLPVVGRKPQNGTVQEPSSAA